MDRKREIYIKLNNLKEIIEILSSIKNSEEELKKLFNLYDQLSFYEDKVFENWSNYLDDISHKLDHVTL